MVEGKKSFKIFIFATKLNLIDDERIDSVDYQSPIKLITYPRNKYR